MTTQPHYRYDSGRDVLLRYDADSDTYTPTHEPEPTAPVPVDRTDIIEPYTLPTAAPATATTHVQLATTYTDRSRGFQLATLPISICFGAGAALVAGVGWSVPALSVTMLAVFWLAFLGWWLVGWLIHHIVSPDGIALVQSLLAWWLVYREQTERIRRYRQ